MDIRVRRLIFTILSLAALGLGLSSCGEESLPYHPVPSVPVNIEFNLTNLQYQPLQQQGWQYLPGGVRGIVILKEGGIYRAFDRNCPYQPQESCAQVDMHSSTLYLIDEGCCESTFNKQGIPTGGPAAMSLREYSVTQDGNYLYIYN